MRAMRAAIWAGLALLVAGLPAAPAADPKDRADDFEKEVRKLVRTIRDKHDVPALGVIVLTSKEVLALHVEGVRKSGTKVKALTTDKFHLGSDTKAFTALLVAVLVQRKLVVYDLTVEKAFPEHAKTMPAGLRKVTLSLLLRHRAGLPADADDWWSYNRKGPTGRQQRQALLKAMLTDRKATVKPDEGFLYSNLGYVLAGAMLERTLNANWEALMKKHVLDPLKMTSAGFGPTSLTRFKIEQPWPHDPDGSPFEPSFNADNPPIMGPAVRMHCSLGDWGKFAADHLKGARGEKALLPKEAYQKLHEPLDKNESYTLGGWIPVPAAGGGYVLLHDGSNTKNYCCAVLDPTRDWAMLVVCNQGKKPGEEACYALRKALLEKMLTRPAAGATKEP
jgi:CubicO group peptidase (beta-lactamase class C family)